MQVYVKLRPTEMSLLFLCSFVCFFVFMRYRWFLYIVGICDFMWHSFLDGDQLKRTCSNARDILYISLCFFHFICQTTATLLGLRGLLFRMQVAHAQRKIRGRWRGLTCSMWYLCGIIYDCICSVPGRTDTSPQWQCGNVIAVLWFPLVATRCSCGVVCCQPEHWLEIMDLNKQSFRDYCIISS